MQQILLVEDDQQLAIYLSDHLSPLGHVTHVDTVKKACELIEATIFDLAIVDRVLPDGDGLEVIAFLNDVSYPTKIVALSKKHQLSERITGLQLGADDYLPKPFTLAELKLKIGKLLHYEKRKALDYLTAPGMTFWPSTGEVLINDTKIRLRKKEARIFQCLVRHQNQVLSRDKIVEESWSLDEELPSQTTLDVYIRRLRILLQEYGAHIVTKRGFGYSFIS